MSDEPLPIDHTEEMASLRQLLDQANQRLIHAELKAHAIRAGIIDLDGLKLLDTSKLKLAADGSLSEAEPAMAALKRDKPWLFAKHSPAHSTSHPAVAPRAEPPAMRKATEMTHDEWQAARARLLKGG